MPHQDSNTLKNIYLNLLEQNWVLHEIYPQFNKYLGASIHAHTSSLFFYQKLGDPSPEKIDFLRYTPFYTGDIRDPGSKYACIACETCIEIGPGKEYLTIQDLKKDGCFECGCNSFRRIVDKTVT
jgi:hypothetical protein